MTVEAAGRFGEWLPYDKYVRRLGSVAVAADMIDHEIEHIQSMQELPDMTEWDARNLLDPVLYEGESVFNKANPESDGTFWAHYYRLYLYLQMADKLVLTPHAFAGDKVNHRASLVKGTADVAADIVSDAVAKFEATANHKIRARLVGVINEYSPMFAVNYTSDGQNFFVPATLKEDMENKIDNIVYGRDRLKGNFRTQTQTKSGTRPLDRHGKPTIESPDKYAAYLYSSDFDNHHVDGEGFRLAQIIKKWDDGKNLFGRDWRKITSAGAGVMRAITEQQTAYNTIHLNVRGHRRGHKTK